MNKHCVRVNDFIVSVMYSPIGTSIKLIYFFGQHIICMFSKIYIYFINGPPFFNITSLPVFFSCHLEGKDYGGGCHN